MADNKISFTRAVYYALPVIASGYMFCLVSLYAMKFSTDVLLIAPAIMGMIFAVSRFWDAVSDPLVGYLSDRTNTRFGRRRPWILAAIPLVCLSFWMVFSPPAELSHAALIGWMTMGVVLFYTAQTVMVIPHMSLGAELTNDQEARNMVFGVRHAGWIGGYILALGTLYLLIRAEGQGEAASRLVASTQSMYMAGVTILFYALCVLRLRERPEYQGRGGVNVWRVVGDVWRNRHARIIYLVHFIQELGMATVVTLTVYMAEYVIGLPALAPAVIFAFLLFSFLFVPVWVRLAKLYGKKRIWIAGSALSVIAFAGLASIGKGDVAITLVYAIIGGLANGMMSVVAPAVLGNVIDYDEHLTGERKEGVYSAVWNFMQKSAFAVMLLVTGFALSWAGFVPKAEQTPLVFWTIKLLYGGLAALMFCISTFVLMRLRFEETEHERIVRELQPDL